MRQLLLPFALSAALSNLVLAACSPDRGSAISETDAASPSAAAPTPADAMQLSLPELGEASAAPAAMPAASHPAYDQTVINFGGYGAASFNVSEQALRRAFGHPLKATPPLESSLACHYLVPVARTDPGHSIAFMFEGAKFVRYDVDDVAIVAPGDITTGMSVGAVDAAFPGQVQVQPHKYVAGGSVRVVRPADGGEARLVFEADATGNITEWRIGVPPQVDYVEGCS